jgi:hypothetical protein
MRKIYIYLFLLVFDKAWADKLPLLEVSNIYSLDWSTRIDISGLTYCNGSLVAIADNIDDTVFKIDVDGNKAKISPFLSLDAIKKSAVDFEFVHSVKHFLNNFIYKYRFDWEGISCTEHEILLASESEAGILIFSLNGRYIDTIGLYSDARRAGYFNDYNAFIEGVASHDDTIFGAVERGPRGIVTIKKRANDGLNISFKNLPNNKKLEYIKNSIDVSDLEVFNGNLYSLERGASAICKRDYERIESISCYSYKQVERAVDTSYLSTEFGVGEGLAISDSKIYVAFDNNGEGRKTDPNDIRPLIIEFYKPSDF